MLAALCDQARTVKGHSLTPTAAIVDSRSVKTTENGGVRGHDAGKKVIGRKRHVAVDVEGTPLVLNVHRADLHDRDRAPEVIVALLRSVPTVQKLFADGGCAGPKLRKTL